MAINGPDTIVQLATSASSLSIGKRLAMLFLQSLTIAVFLLWTTMAFSGDTLKKTLSQTIYVPIYSSIQQQDRRITSLAVTISIRNVDPHAGLTVMSAEYYDNRGDPIKTFVANEVVLPPLATTEIFIQSTELREGTGANFLVRWKADKPTLSPLIEAIMIGRVGTTGLAFSSRGVVIDDVGP